MDGQGNALAVWIQKDDGDVNGLFSNWHESGGIWNRSAVQSVENISTGVSRFQLLMGEQGHAYVVWDEDQDPDILYGILSWGDIYTNRYIAEEGWSENPQLISVRTSEAFGGNQFPSMALGSEGSAMAVWMKRNFGWGVIFIDSVVANHLQGGFIAWNDSGIAEIEQGDEKSSAPQVASDGKGTYLVAWEEWLDADGTRQVVNTRYFDAQVSSWESSPVIISEIEDLIQFDSLKLVMNANGNGVAIWVQGDNLWARRFVAGSGWETSAVMIDHGAEPVIHPQAAMDGKGNIIAVWEQDEDIWANIYDAHAGSWLTEQNVDDLHGQALHPQISMHPLGTAVAVWEREGKVYAKLFE
jgi:head-tail adaptor